jgi:hypothetical protein
VSDRVVDSLGDGVCPSCGQRPTAVLHEAGANRYRFDGPLPVIEARRPSWWAEHGDARCELGPSAARALTVVLLGDRRPRS